MKTHTSAITILACILLLVQCKKDVEGIGNNTPTGETIEVSLTAGTGGEKTDIDGLSVEWVSGDKIYVAGSEDGYLGFLTTQDDGNPVDFSGFINKTTTSQTYYFYYVGENEFALGGTNNDEFTFSVEEQYGILSDDANSIASRFQLAKGSKAIEGTPGRDLGNVTLNNMMAVSHLNFKACGVSMGGELTDIVTVSGTGCYSTGTLNIKTGALNADAGNITLKRASGNYYMALIPADQTAASALSLTFTATSSEGEYANITPTVAANMFYNKDVVKAIDMCETDEWINFGLPSPNQNLKWAKYNLGVDPSDLDEITDWYGDYYAWGEIEPYYLDGHAYDSPCSSWKTGKETGYKWTSYPYHDGTEETGEQPYDAETKILKPSCDVAHTSLSGTWRMPTGGDNGEWKQLKSNTYFVWTTNYNDVEGLKGYIVYKVTAAADKGKITNENTSYTPVGTYNPSVPHMFLPAACCRNGLIINNIGEGYYWSSTLNTSVTTNACEIRCTSILVLPNNSYVRYYGFPVRPVRI